MHDQELAEMVAAEAGRLLMATRVQAFADRMAPNEVKALGDRTSHEFLMGRLGEERPGDHVLSEEGRDSTERLGASRVWIVDPLDGTREFSEEGRDDWAVHVALWSEGELVAGAVARPAMGDVLGAGARLAPAAPAGRLRIAVSRTRPPGFVNALCDYLDAEPVPMGSAGIKATSVLDGTTDAYVHAGGQFEWDSAAPVAVARAAGLHTSRVDGGPLRYNQPDPYLPDLLICRPEHAADLLEAMAQLEERVAVGAR